MAINTKNAKCTERTFNTLAQLRTNNSTSTVNNNEIQLFGTGSDAINTEKNAKRAKRKIVANSIVFKLIDIAKQKKDSVMLKSLWNTYHCQNDFYLTGDRIYTTYCKNRICPICNGNRKAELINKYLPILNQWIEPYFVTLTIKSVPAKTLGPLMQNMKKGLNMILNKYYKQHLRNNGKKLIGIKSLECNFNPKYKTYNPHFHLIVKDKETAEILIKEWQLYANRKSNKWTRPYAQHSTKVESKETCLIEIIKYGTKLFTPNNENLTSEKDIKIYAKAIYNILKSMQGIRLFDKFGFEVPKQEKHVLIKTVTDYTKYKFEPKVQDWINQKTGLKLSDYMMTSELLNILTNNIDTIIE